MNHFRCTPRLSVLLVAASAGLCALSPKGVAAQPTSAIAGFASEEAAAVRMAVERYFQAADSGSADNVRSVFWPTGRVEGVAGKSFLSWSADEFATRHFRGQPRPSSNLTRTIEWLDVSGTGAVARVKITMGPAMTYWDYFTLHKMDGQWKIGLKAFANPEAP
jgi:hypothetical protein